MTVSATSFVGGLANEYTVLFAVIEWIVASPTAPEPSEKPTALTVRFRLSATPAARIWSSVP